MGNVPLSVIPHPLFSSLPGRHLGFLTGAFSLLMGSGFFSSCCATNMLIIKKKEKKKVWLTWLKFNIAFPNQSGAAMWTSICFSNRGVELFEGIKKKGDNSNILTFRFALPNVLHY